MPKSLEQTMETMTVVLTLWVLEWVSAEPAGLKIKCRGCVLIYLSVA